MKISEANGVDSTLAHAIRMAGNGELVEIAIAGRCSNGDSFACASKMSAQLLGAVNLLAVGMANGIIRSERDMD